MNNIRKFPFVLLLPYAVAALIFLVVAVLAQTTDIQVGQLTRDVAGSADLPPYMGIISEIGILLWCSTVAICFFSYALTRRIMRLGEAGPFLLTSGFVTAFLMLDDSFLLHETITGALDGREVYVFTVYIAIVLSYLVFFRNAILATGPLLLMIAFGFLGLSIFIDIQPLPGLTLGAQLLLEDGFKLFGIISWFLYFARMCAGFVSGALGDPPLAGNGS